MPPGTQRGVIGALVVQSYSSDARHTEQNKALLQFVSTQVAATIERKQTKTWLQYVARHEALERISHCLRESDTVGRVGGDEFVMLLNGISLPEHAAAAAEKSAPRSTSRSSWPATTCTYRRVRPSRLPRTRRRRQQLIRYADDAMYSAKRQGGNRLLMAESRRYGTGFDTIAVAMS